MESCDVAYQSHREENVQAQALLGCAAWHVLSAGETWLRDDCGDSQVSSVLASPSVSYPAAARHPDLVDFP